MQNAAFILIGLGVLAITGWAVRGFFTAGDIPILLRIAVGVIGTGMLILIGVAIKERISRAKGEDYKEVQN